jgi:general stress protein YciG
MAGTKAGGAKAAATNKAKYGADFYGKIGQIGGKLGTTGGFYASKVTGKNWHKEAGRKGGTISRRRKRDE